MSCYPCWVGFDHEAGFEQIFEPLSHLIHIPENNPSKTHRFAELDFGGIYIWSVMDSLWGINRHVYSVCPGNVLSHKIRQLSQKATCLAIVEN